VGLSSSGISPKSGTGYGGHSSKMISRFICLFSLFLICNLETFAYRLPLLSVKSSRNAFKASSSHLSRQSFLKLTTTALLLPTLPAIAEVSAGTSLPDGANQFSKVLKSKTEGQCVCEVAR
jgi:hypothetical protein